MTAPTTPPEIRLANNIAANLRHLPGDRAAQAVADHIRRFWDPAMRARLTGVLDGPAASGLDPLAVTAARLIR